MGVARPPARMVIARTRCSGRGLSRGSQAENLCAIPMPPLKSKRQSQHHHLPVHHAVIWPQHRDGPGQLLRSLYPTALWPYDTDTGNCYSDSSSLFNGPLSLTVWKDRGPYDNKTPAELCLFNTNDKLLGFREPSCV